MTTAFVAPTLPARRAVTTVPRERVDAAPRTRMSLPHRPALDGLRGLAVLGVVLYHLDLPWARGGFLGVSLFFTLSGFLITNLLLIEARSTDRIDLFRFWARRFRRLLPAAVFTIGVVVAFAWFAGSAEQLRELRADVAASLGYAANWRFLLSGDAYGAGYEEPSALQHFWSLAIEEQFYVVYPVLAVALVRAGFRRRGWLITLGVLAAASAASTLLAGGDAARVYFGTDTRAFELLAGAVLAVVAGVGVPRVWERAGGSRHVVAIAAAGATLLAWSLVDVGDAAVRRGGLLAVAGLSCVLIVGALDGGSPLARVLTWRPLTTLGLVSYGVYLFHWPVFRWLTPERAGFDGLALIALRLGVTAAATALSYHLIEQPIRNGRVRVGLPRFALAAPVLVVALLAGAQTAAERGDERAVDLDLAASIVVEADASLAGEPALDAVPAVVAPPERVLFLGDSLVHQSLPGIDEVFAARSLEVRAVGGAGETLLGDRGRWLDALAREIDRFDPDVVVLEACCGFGDPRVDEHYEAPDGRVLALDSPELYDEWARVAERATDIALTRGAQVLWVLAPPAQTNGYYGPIEGRIAHVNAIYRDLARCRTEVGLVDWRVVAAADGSFTESLPGRDGDTVKVRHDDGLHFTPAGVGLIAQRTLDTIDARWSAAGGRLSAARASHTEHDDVQCDGAVHAEGQ